MKFPTMEEEMQRLLAHIDTVSVPRPLDVMRETLDQRAARIDRRRFLANPEVATGFSDFPLPARVTEAQQ